MKILEIKRTLNGNCVRKLIKVFFILKNRVYDKILPTVLYSYRSPITCIIQNYSYPIKYSCRYKKFQRNFPSNQSNFPRSGNRQRFGFINTFLAGFSIIFVDARFFRKWVPIDSDGNFIKLIAQKVILLRHQQPFPEFLNNRLV